jgi:hypothetical protein
MRDIDEMLMTDSPNQPNREEEFKLGVLVKHEDSGIFGIVTKEPYEVSETYDTVDGMVQEYPEYYLEVKWADMTPHKHPSVELLYRVNLLNE